MESALIDSAEDVCTLRSLKVTWTGIRPLIMHNGRLADPTDPYVRKIKEITNKGSKKMTDADHEKRNRLEWEGGLYWDETAGPFIPSDNIERCIQKGAQKSRRGNDIQAACFVSDEIVALKYVGPRTMDGLYKDPRFSIRRGVGVNQNRIFRVRPMFPTGWSITFTLEYDSSVIENADMLVKAMRDAGALTGFGDWRPKFGRFTVEVIDNEHN